MKAKRFTIEDLEKKMNAGTLKLTQKELTEFKAKILVSEIKKVVIQSCHQTAGKDFINLVLPQWCREHGLNLHDEYKFHPIRKWRFDWAITSPLNPFKVAIEYEGLSNGGYSAHTTVKGYLGNLEKYNAATCMGWRLLRYGGKGYKAIVDDLDFLFDNHF